MDGNRSVDVKRKPPAGGYLVVPVPSYLTEAHQKRLLADAEACVHFVRRLVGETTQSTVVALHFGGDAFEGGTVEDARLWESTLILPDNLLKVSAGMGGDLVVLVYRPSARGLAEASPALADLTQQIAEVLRENGVTLWDLILDGTPTTRDGVVSVLHPGGREATPFDEE